MKTIVGRRIVEVRPMTRPEARREGWEPDQARSPGEATVLVLDDGTILYPSRDDEGNGPGALFGADREGGLFTVSPTNWTWDAQGKRATDNIRRSKSDEGKRS
jgi:hypothetical protein